MIAIIMELTCGKTKGEASRHKCSKEAIFQRDTRRDMRDRKIDVRCKREQKLIEYRCACYPYLHKIKTVFVPVSA